MKKEQKRLFDHYMDLAKTNNGIVGKNAKKYADEILKSFPEFATKVKESK